MDKKALKGRMVALLKKSERTLPQLSKHLKITYEEVGILLEELGREHPGISRMGDKIFVDDARLRSSDPLTFKLPHETGKIGAISCTHLGSKYQQISALYAFYEECEKVGCSHVLHCGDATEGDGRVYRGQRFEMFLHGFSEQRDYFVEAYPKSSSIKTWMIGGNHDDAWPKAVGLDILQEICKEREDLDYLGRYAAFVELQEGSVRTKLHHADGGGSYAVSYKPQKFIEGLAPDEKPQLYLLGHYHRVEQLFLRNVHLIQVGCFQAQTPWLARKGLSPDIGGWIIEYDIGADGWSLESIWTRLVPTYKPIKEDYKNYPH